MTKKANQSVEYQMGPLDESFERIKRNQGRIAEAYDIAKVRVAEGKGGPLAELGWFTAESLIYIPQGTILVTRPDFNPILQSPKGATAAHRAGDMYFIGDDVAAKLLYIAETDSREDPEERRVFRWDGKRDYTITTPLAEDNLSRFLLRNRCNSYDAFLSKNGVKKRQMWAIQETDTNKYDRPFAMPLTFFGFRSAPLLFGDSVNPLHMWNTQFIEIRQKPLEERVVGE